MKKTLILILIVIKTNIIFGQGINMDISRDNINEHYNITAPSASAFESVTSTNVNEAFGTANIKIPLFQIKEGNINIPIYLTYNSQGLKVDQVESNVGLGWSISSIFISREIRDAQDMDNGPQLNKIGYFKKKKNNIEYDFTNNNQNTRSRRIDMLPDIYNMYAADGKHTFFFESENDYRLLSKSSIIVAPKKDSVIVYGPQNVKVKDFYSFKIKDENGLDYDFSDYNVALSRVEEKTKQSQSLVYSSMPYVSNWFVSKIEDKINNKKVEFEYVEGKSFSRGSTFNARDLPSGLYSNRYIFPPYPATMVTGFYYNKIFPDYPPSYDGTYFTLGFLSASREKISIKTTAPTTYDYSWIENDKYYQKNIYVKKIKFSQGYLLFDYDNNISKYDQDMIKSIRLYDYNDRLIKEINLNYSYFSGNQPKLKLDSVEDVNIGFTKFTYDETLSLPNPNSNSFDYNGYYNGNYDYGTGASSIMQDKLYYYPNSKEWSLLPFKINNNQIPQHEIPYVNPYGTGVNNRLPDFDYAKTGILTSIEYPTGGKQEYEYELNNFTIKNSQQVGCGLRVKSTTLKDENDRIQDKTIYKYVNEDNTSSGEMIYPPNTGYPLARLFQSEYDYDNHTITTNYNGLPNFISDQLYKLFKIYDMPSESPIRYKRVEKILLGKGKEIIEFIDKNQTSFGNSIHYPLPNINITGVVTNHNFSEFLYTNSAYSLRFNNYFDLSQFSNEKKHIYKDVNNITKQEDIFDYDLLSPAFDSFSAHGNFIRPIITYHSKEANYEYGAYPDLFLSQGSIYLNYNYSLILPSKKTTIFRNNSGTTFSNSINYNYSLNRHSMPMTHSYNIESDGYINGTGNLFFDNLSSTILNLNLKNKVTGSYMFNGYDVLDEFERPYGYKNRIRSEYNSDSETSNLFKPKRITTDLGQGESIDGTFDRYDNKGNLLQSTKDGISTTYIYGYNQNYPIAKIDGATYEQIMNIFGKNPNDNQAYLELTIVSKSNLDKDADTEKALIKELDLFRSNSGLSNYQVTTYTHNPLIGVTSITPPNGLRANYKYDSTNRLIEVKDINGRIIQENKYNYKQ